MSKYSCLGTVCGYCVKADFRICSPEFFKENHYSCSRDGEAGRILCSSVKKDLLCPKGNDPFIGSCILEFTPCIETPLLFQIISLSFN